MNGVGLENVSQLSYDDGRVYRGEISKDTQVPNGQGELIWANGDRHVGSFVGGTICGPGKMVFGPNKPKTSPSTKGRPLWMAGIFMDGLLQGKGVKAFSIGASDEAVQWYQGEFNEGRMEGKGTFVDRLADCVTAGEFKNNQVHGYAVRKFGNGDVVCGEFIRGSLCGKCTYRFANGGIYEGEFTQEGANGFGVKQLDGMRYTGEFKNDKFHGRGVLQFKSGDVYKGEFRNDALHGKGVYQFENDDWCSGTFVQDQMSGPGEFFFANGDKYVGGFLNDEIHGTGVYHFGSTNEIYEGEFEGGKLQPYGRKTLPDGSTLEGKFQDGRPDGKCIFTYKSGPKKGQTIEVIYTDGKLNDTNVGANVPQEVNGIIAGQ